MADALYKIFYSNTDGPTYCYMTELQIADNLGPDWLEDLEAGLIKGVHFKKCDGGHLRTGGSRLYLK